MGINNTIVVSEVNTLVLGKFNTEVLNAKMSLGKRIVIARKLAKMSQEELADAVGCTQGLISKLERGDQNETGLIVKIAKATNTDPFWLDSGEGEPSTSLKIYPNTPEAQVVLSMQKMEDYTKRQVVKISNSLTEPAPGNGTHKEQ